MDKLYMVILLLTIIPILICIKYARKVKSDVADSITRCLFFVTITIISNIVFAFRSISWWHILWKVFICFSLIWC